METQELIREALPFQCSPPTSTAPPPQGSLTFMRTLKIVFSTKAVLAAVIILEGALSTRASADPIREGIAIQLAGRTATLIHLDTLPCVESEYTRRFKFDTYENPKLKELRARYKLEEVVAPGRDEFDRQVLLMDWTHQQFKKFGQPSTSARG